jgi:Transcriptional regulator
VPTPDRTSLPEIVAAAVDLLESDGLDGVTMNAVATRVGVRAPSLYKRVRNRDGLVRLVAEDALADLAARIAALADPDRHPDPARRLAALARDLRAFARERPGGYRLIFAPPAGEAALEVDAIARASAPLLAAAAELAGEEHALEAARTVTAWATGFIAMELAGAFQLGGDVDDAYEYGLSRVLAALRVG